MADKLTGPRVLALIGREKTGPDLWRAIQPMTALDARGYPAGWTYKDTPDVGLIATAADGFLLPRISWPSTHRRMAQAWFDDIRAQGKFVVYDADDDVFTSAESHRRVELNWTDGKSFEQLEAERFERIWALQQCDGVTVSTQRLATIVRSLTSKPVIVVPNSIDLRWFRGVVRASTRQIPGLTIGWAGGRRHDRDVEDMATAWGRIASKYPAVRFVVQGWVPPIILENVGRDRLAILPWMPLETYPYGLAQIDIGCAAAADTPFNRPKSMIKAMEYAAAGAAVVASPTLYEWLVTDGLSGYIAETAAEWEGALSQMIDSPSLRSIMAKRLLKVVTKRHSLDGNLWKWPAAWATIAESARARGRLVTA